MQRHFLRTHFPIPSRSPEGCRSVAIKCLISYNQNITQPSQWNNTIKHKALLCILLVSISPRASQWFQSFSPTERREANRRGGHRASHGQKQSDIWGGLYEPDGDSEVPLLWCWGTLGPMSSWNTVFARGVVNLHLGALSPHGGGGGVSKYGGNNCVVWLMDAEINIVTVIDKTSVLQRFLWRFLKECLNIV